MPISTLRTQGDSCAGLSGASRQLRASKYFLLVGISLAVYGVIVPFASAQLPDTLPSSMGSASQQDVDNGDSTTNPASGTRVNSQNERNPSLDAAAPSELSAEQIIDILQRYPDLVAEIKSLAADRLQAQGSQIDPNDISDQMLFSQIAANSSLRAYITTYLSARGYVTEESLAASRLTSSSMENASPAGGRLSSETGEPDAPRSRAQNETLPSRNSSDDNRLTAASAPTARRFDSKPPRGEVRTNASTDPPQAIHLRTPYDLRSMRDLYAQIPGESTPLKRFGSEVFLLRNASAATLGAAKVDTQLDVPLGPDYVLGPGDTLEIDIWGGLTQKVVREVGRDGRIMLPEAGSLQVAGLSLRRAQDLVESALKPQFRDVHVAVTVSRLHSVRVYVVGDVQRPGGYDLSSLSTPLSALYAAGGPTSVGSLRMMHHMRGKELVENIDLYDFLLNGVRNGSARFESGDTLQVPPVGALIAISGAVKRPAIYELKSGENSLADVIDDAGGFSPVASLSHITIERIDANQHRETVTLHPAKQDDPVSEREAVNAFQVRDGDRIRIAPILPYSERAIYLEGHVVRPGRFSYTDGMRLSDVLHSYRDLLPEPASHGEVVRLVPPDLHAETIDFDVAEVLIGNTNALLQPFDTVRIFGRYEIDAPQVSIRGEVLRPAPYPLSKGMTATQLVRMAGGFKRDALLESADLTSYEIINGNHVIEHLSTVRIGAAVTGADPNADVVLKAGDILSVHQITGWNNIGESVSVQGQVRFPGSYGFTDGERLSAVLRRAGGFLSVAYPAGAVLVRDQVRELEQQSRDELIRQIQTNSAAARLSPGAGGAQAVATLQLVKAQQDQVIAELTSHPPTGRMVIRISADIDSWASTPADIELRPGDVLTVPKRPGFVLVTGQVYNATALTFAPDKTAAWYLSHAGGTNTTANRREVFIIRANGSVVGRHSGKWLEGDVLSTRLEPGDVVVVPQKIIGASQLWRNILTAAQIASSIAITSAVTAL
jgi:protein involved in polysaccharide export with SLBB domain